MRPQAGRPDGQAPIRQAGRFGEAAFGFRRDRKARLLVAAQVDYRLEATLGKTVEIIFARLATDRKSMADADRLEHARPSSTPPTATVAEVTRPAQRSHRAPGRGRICPTRPPTLRPPG